MTKKTFTDWIVLFWWMFPLATVLVSVATSFAFDVSTGFGLVLCGVAAISLLLQLPVFVILLIKKKWWRTIGTFFAGIISLALFAAIPFLFISMFVDSMPDNFGKKHPITQGIEYNVPLSDPDCKWNAVDGYIFDPVDIDSTDTTSWLQIWNGMQGGIYHYSLYWTCLDDGEIYLRCYEVTENIRLSSDQVKSSTTTQIIGHNEFGQVVDHKRFTIYEGDWEDYYAVRVEVWHKPIKGTPHKLMEKVYRMEGWMR